MTGDRPKVLLVCNDAERSDLLAAIIDRRFVPVCVPTVDEALVLLKRAGDSPFSAVVADDGGERTLEFVRLVGRRWLNVGALLISDRDVKPERDDRLTVLRDPGDATELLMWVEHVVTASGMFRLLRDLRREIRPGGTTT